MSFTTSFEPIVKIAWWIGLGCSALAIAIFALIAVLRLRAAYELRREQAVLRKWQPIFAKAALDDDKLSTIEMPALLKPEIPIFLTEWIRVQETIRGRSAGRLNRLLRRLKLAAACHGFLHHNRVEMRLLATVALGHLRDKTAWNRIFEELDSPSTLLSLAAATSLVRIAPARAVPEIIDRLPDRQDWPIGRIATILRLARMETLVEPLAAALTRADDSQAIALLPYTVLATSPDLDAAVNRVLGRTSNPDVISAGLKALHSPAQLKMARRFLAHEAWFVRVQAVHFLGETGSRADHEALVEALGDPEWWVRYRSAQALAGSPWITGTELANIQLTHPDRFARDILGQVIAETGIA